MRRVTNTENEPSQVDIQNSVFQPEEVQRTPTKKENKIIKS